MLTYKRTVKARAGDGYDIHIVFEDGTEGVLDFSPFMQYGCYAPLKERGLFELVTADHGTLSWPGNIDIAPEAVWEDAVRTAQPSAAQTI